MVNMGKIFHAAVLALVLTVSACTGGGGESEGPYAGALASVNKDWKIYEMKKEKDQTVIRVEVGENVAFADGKKAADAIQKADPKFNGYIEFFNSEVGMVIRKVEIFPAT